MPTLSQLKHAVSIAEQIEKLQAELAGLVGGSAALSVKSTATISAVKSAVKTPAPKTASSKRFVSPEARAKMAAAQAARWAKARGTSAAPVSAVAAKPSAAPKAAKTGKKGGLSPEGRARIVAALKARHAANRKAKK